MISHRAPRGHQILVNTSHSKYRLPTLSIPAQTAQPPALPPILSTNDTDLAAYRPISWQSTTSTNTNSTVSPGDQLFDDALFDAFHPSRKRFHRFHTRPALGLEPTKFPRTSMHEVSRSVTLPPRTRKHSAQKPWINVSGFRYRPHSYGTVLVRGCLLAYRSLF